MDKHELAQREVCDRFSTAFTPNADSLDSMFHDAGFVSSALAAANIRHRFEIYDDEDASVGYLHHNWPEAPVA